jgi:hypothetical protein
LRAFSKFLLLSQIDHDLVGYVQRVGQKHPHETHRRQLQSEPELTMVPPAAPDQRLVSVIEKKNRSSSAGDGAPT